MKHKNILLVIAVSLSLMGGVGMANTNVEGSEMSRHIDHENRATMAETNYSRANSSIFQKLESTDPEFVAMEKKYIYGDIQSQTVLSPVEHSLVTISVVVTDQNFAVLPSAVEEALAVGAEPVEIREAIYHITPYVGVGKTIPALEVMNNVFKKHKITLPLDKQGTTIDSDRFVRGLGFQVDTYGDRINQMRNNTPEAQKHLQDNLSAHVFGDIYSRGTHDLKMREYLTVAAIGTLGIEAQFKSHVRGTLAAGATKEEVVGVITSMNPYVGFPRTLWMMNLANQVFSEQG